MNKALQLTCVYLVALILSACGGSSNNDDSDIVAPITNISPTANAGPDQQVADLAVVVLDGSASADSDGSITSYKWTQVSGKSVSLDDAGSMSPRFNAPNIQIDETLVFKLDVTDDDNATSSDNVSIQVKDSNLAPDISIEGISEVNEQGTVELSAVVSDERLETLNIDWQQISGPTVELEYASSLKVGFQAPATSKDEVLEFELKVTDDEGKQSTVIHTLNIVDLPFTLISDSSSSINPAERTQFLNLTFSENVISSDVVVNLFENDEPTTAEILVNEAEILILPDGGFKFNSSYKVLLSELKSFSQSQFEGQDFEFNTIERAKKIFVGAVVTDGVLNAMNVNDNSWTPESLFGMFNDNGIANFRLGIRRGTNPELENEPLDNWPNILSSNDLVNSWSSRELARYTIEKGGLGGTNHSVFLFLSDDATHASKYFPGEDWQSLSFENRLLQIELHAAEVMQYYIDHGIAISQIEIGNEVDFGIAGVQIGDSLVGSDIDINLNDNSAETKLWPYHLAVFEAAARGIRAKSKDVKIAIHLAGMAYSENNRYTIGFYDFLVANNVDFDVIGLSYPYLIFPYNDDVTFPYFKDPNFKLLLNSLSKLGKEVQISEFSYFSDPRNIKVTVSDEYSNNEVGQANFLRDFLKELNRYPAVTGAYYFYADYNDLMQDNEELIGIGLLKDQATPKMALSESIRNFVLEQK